MFSPSDTRPEDKRFIRQCTLAQDIFLGRLPCSYRPRWCRSSPEPSPLEDTTTDCKQWSTAAGNTKLVSEDDCTTSMNIQA